LLTKYLLAQRSAYSLAFWTRRKDQLTLFPIDGLDEPRREGR